MTLTIGAVTEEVMVTGESIAQVETSSSELSSTISGKQVDELVLNGRNFTQLVTLSPGVVNQTGTDDGKVGVYGNVAYSMNGGRTEYNNWELDGGDNMDNGTNATLNVYPNPEAIAEFKVLTSNYGAQYGRNGSGTVEVETKSGTSFVPRQRVYYGRNESSTRRIGRRAYARRRKGSLQENMIRATPSAGRFIFLTSTTPTRRKHTSSGPRNGAVKNSTTSYSPNVPSDDERSGSLQRRLSRSQRHHPVDRTTFPDCPVTRALAWHSRTILSPT